MNHCYLFMGPSGSGKTSLAEKAFAPEQKIISYTTREPRQGEVSGRDYFFITKKDFKQMIMDNQFAEFDVYDEHFYGIAIDTLQKALAKGHCYDPITVMGFLNLHQLFGDQVIPIWINISKETLLTRLNKRSTPTEVERRLARFESDQQEYEKLKKFPTLIEIDGETSLKEMMQQLHQSLN